MLGTTMGCTHEFASGERRWRRASACCLDGAKLLIEDHPFHIHGTFFQVASEDKAPAELLANKDTVIVRQMSTVNPVVRFDEPGRWMYHCHIFGHADGGMMGELDVVESRE